MVQQTLQQGLRRCRCLHKNTPQWAIEWLCGEHNRHHKGSGETALGLIDEALRVEAAWRKKCTTDGITTRHPNYQRTYDDWVRNESETFKESVNLYTEAKSLGHALETWDVAKDFEEGSGWAGLELES